MSETRCESCTMPIESGPYCQHCSDSSGALHPFEETYARFEQWTKKEEPDIDAEALRKKVFAFMAETPAWKNHPEVQGDG